MAQALQYEERNQAGGEKNKNHEPGIKPMEGDVLCRDDYREMPKVQSEFAVDINEFSMLPLLVILFKAAIKDVLDEPQAQYRTARACRRLDV